MVDCRTDFKCPSVPLAMAALASLQHEGRLLRLMIRGRTNDRKGGGTLIMTAVRC